MHPSRSFLFPTVLAAGLALAAGCALADINVGVTVSATGPAASLGIPEKNTIALLPQTVAGQAVHYIVLDDGSDTVKAVSNARKLISEDKVDVLVGVGRGRGEKAVTSRRESARGGGERY